MKKKIGKLIDLKYIVIAIISALINAFAIVNFTIPARLYPAGFSGISRLTSDVLYDFFNIPVSYSILYFGFNIILTLFVFNKIGKKFIIYSVVQFSLVSVFSSIMPQTLFIDDILLASIFGGIINGIAVGLALSYNFSTGGTDFLSTFFSHKYKKDIWNYTFGFNVCILVVAGLIYDWEKSLYSIFFQYASTRIIRTLNGRYTFKTLTIFTKHPNEVAKAITDHVRHGVTEIEATGYFSQEKTTMLYTVVNTYQYKFVEELILETDPHAFINIQSTNEVRGNYYQQPLD